MALAADVDGDILCAWTWERNPYCFGLQPSTESDAAVMQRHSTTGATHDRVILPADDPRHALEEVHYRTREVLVYATWNPARRAFVADLGELPHENLGACVSRPFGAPVGRSWDTWTGCADVLSGNPLPPQPVAYDPDSADDTASGDTEEKTHQPHRPIGRGPCECQAVVESVVILSCVPSWSGESQGDPLQLMPLEVLCSKLKLLPRLFLSHATTAPQTEPMRFLKRYWSSVASSGLTRDHNMPWAGLAQLIDTAADGESRQVTVASYANRAMDLACDMPQLAFRHPYDLFYGMFACAAMQTLADDSDGKYPYAIQHILRDTAWESGKTRFLERWKTVKCATRLMLTGLYLPRAGPAQTQDKKATNPTGLDANATANTDAANPERTTRIQNATLWTNQQAETLCTSQRADGKKAERAALGPVERAAYVREMLPSASSQAMEYLCSTGGPQKCGKFAAQCIESQYLVWTPERRLQLLLFPFDSDQQTLHAHRDKFGHTDSRLGLDVRLSLRLFHPRYDLLRYYE